MAFAILVTKAKFKCRKSNMRSLKVKEAHINRDENVKNIALHADPNLKHLNEQLIGDGKIYDAVKEEIKDCVWGKNQNGGNSPVVCFDLLLTASPQYFYEGDSLETCTYVKRVDYEDRLKAWKDKAVAYLKKEHYCVSATLHNDESSPHIHASIIPFQKDEQGIYDKTKTNAKAVMKFKKFQNDYYAQVGKPLNLERGNEKSTAHHVDLKTWYKGVNKKVVAYEEALTKPLAKIDRRFARVETELITEKKGWFGTADIVDRDAGDVKTDTYKIATKTVMEITAEYKATTDVQKIKYKVLNDLYKRQLTNIQHLTNKVVETDEIIEKQKESIAYANEIIEKQNESITIANANYKILGDFLNKEHQQQVKAEFQIFYEEQKALLVESKKPQQEPKPKQVQEDPPPQQGGGGMGSGNQPGQEPKPKPKPVLQVEKPKTPIRGMRL